MTEPTPARLAKLERELAPLRVKIKQVEQNHEQITKVAGEIADSMRELAEILDVIAGRGR